MNCSWKSYYYYIWEKTEQVIYNLWNNVCVCVHRQTQTGPFLSGFKPGYYSEIASVVLIRELYQERDRGILPCWFSLYVFMAFDIIDLEWLWGWKHYIAVIALLPAQSPPDNSTMGQGTTTTTCSHDIYTCQTCPPVLLLNISMKHWELSSGILEHSVISMRITDFLPSPFLLNHLRRFWCWNRYGGSMGWIKTKTLQLNPTKMEG